MDEGRLRALFTGLTKLEQSKPEATFLSIGGRGYYENPASDLLKFFLEPSNAHRLGTLFIDALLKVIDFSVPSESLHALTVRREVPTTNNNRIDLSLKGEGWIILIENKIWHEQINPFEDYKALAKQCMLDGDKPHYVILSPSGDSSQEGWEGLSYRKLIDAVKVGLDACDCDKKATKWWHFAQDFIVHLDQELYTKAMTSDEIKFVEDNYKQLAEFAQLERKYQEHLLSYLPAKIDETTEKKGACAKEDTWCIRLYHPEWQSAEIAWFDERQNGNRFKLRVYMQGMSEDPLRLAKSAFEGTHGMEYATESGNWHRWTTLGEIKHGKPAEAMLLKLSAELFKIMKSIR